MSTMLAILAYMAALAVPAFLLYHFGSYAWYWHILSLLAALGIGFMPTPAALANPVCELLTGIVFVVLLIWGVGGLIAFRPHRERHA